MVGCTDSTWLDLQVVMFSCSHAPAWEYSAKRTVLKSTVR